LLQYLDRLDTIEIDRDIVARLRQSFAADRIAVHECDALEFDFSFLGSDLRVVGNLPYNISTPLLFRLTAYAAFVRDAYFMLQREVVQRMNAQPDTPEYGRLSVMLQYRWAVDSLFDVEPGAFRPAPKVWSSVVRLVPHASLPWQADDEVVF